MHDRGHSETLFATGQLFNCGCRLATRCTRLALLIHECLYCLFIAGSRGRGARSNPTPSPASALGLPWPEDVALQRPCYCPDLIVRIGGSDSSSGFGNDMCWPVFMQVKHFFCCLTLVQHPATVKGRIVPMFVFDQAKNAMTKSVRYTLLRLALNLYRTLWRYPLGNVNRP